MHPLPFSTKAFNQNPVSIRGRLYTSVHIACLPEIWPIVVLSLAFFLCFGHTIKADILLSAKIMLSFTVMVGNTFMCAGFYHIVCAAEVYYRLL